MSALFESLRRQMAALDDAALEALANRGLLRRARKDLEGAEVSVAGETGSALRLRVGESEVTLPETGAVQARCSCPASGVCQHILATCLWLREQPPAVDTEAAPAPAIADELLAIQPEEMEKWAGRATLRAAFGLAAQAGADVLVENSITVTFRALNATCRFVPGGGLAGAIVTGAPKDAARLTLAALLAFQKSRRLEWPDARGEIGTTLAEGSGAPRSREEVLAAASALLCETIHAGLARASSSAPERFATLSVSALAVNLPRLALALGALAQELRLTQARDAAADASRTFASVARTYALCTALATAGASAPAPLIGWHRTVYSDIGHLELAGVCAWPWETASGYRGLTVLFWDTVGRAWNSWSEARPRHIDPSYHPRGRFGAASPWAGAESPAVLARSRFRLLHARRNPMGRLSASSKSRVALTGTTNVLEIGAPVRTRWSELTGGASLGLAENNPLDDIHLVRPAAWGPRLFDPVTQTLRWLLLDSEKASLLQVRFSPHDEPALKFLEAFDPSTAPGACLIGRVLRTPEGLVLQPHGLVSADGTTRHLALETVSTILTMANALPAPGTEEEEDSPEEEVRAASDQHDSPTTRLLSEMEDVLTALAEGGASALNPPRRAELARLAKRSSLLGWQLLPAEFARLAAAPASDPPSLLRCRYACLLHQQALLSS